MARRDARGLLGVIGLILLIVGGCESTPSPTLGPAPPTEPIIRVRLDDRLSSATISGPPAVQVLAAGYVPQTLDTPITIRRLGGRWRIANSDLSDAGAPELIIRPLGAEPLRYDKQPYPGILHAVARTGGEQFDLVNHLRLEAYLPGVLDRELYDHWHLATYHAQAVAARSYAIYQLLSVPPDRHYDLEDTQASQAYAGLTSHRLALQAVRDTAGLVLSDGQSIICAYYSSTCGGSSLSPTEAFGISSGPGLVPESHEPWCNFSKHFRHSDISRSRAALTRRLAAYGRRHGLSLAKLGGLRSLSIAERNAAGRPTRFAIVGTDGKVHHLRADSFRNACNFGVTGLPSLRGNRLPSSYFEVSVSGDRVLFTGIRGYGHGVGLCQFGAEGMARAGHDSMTILNTYYPGARIERAY